MGIEGLKGVARRARAGLAALAVAMAAGSAAQAAAPVKMALTFDDLPAHSALPPGVSRMDVAGRLLAAFHDAGTGPVYGFVNGVLEEREPDAVGVLSLWRAAGHPLGNHTWTHMSLNSWPTGRPTWSAMSRCWKSTWPARTGAGSAIPTSTKARRPRSTWRPARC
jgi:peptidoglycan/xylan/chitin deacetylase (PgdA/CDA1 family)